MAYQFEADESVSDGVKRIALEQLSSVLEQLGETRVTKQDRAIHQARKGLKKLRALLRLVRTQLGKEDYHRENACFRDAGRVLSTMRDAQVRLSTLEDLTEHFADHLSTKDPFAKVHKALKADYQAARKQMLGQEDAMAKAAALIQAAQTRIETWPLKECDWSDLSKGLKRIYKQGNQGFIATLEHPSSENFHNWRKRGKDLWYHLRLLRPIWPEVMKPLASQAKQLGDALGDDHDLAVLQQTLLKEPEQYGDPNDLEMLLALIDQRQSQLQLTAKYLGQRLYAEKPSAFADRMGSYWQTWTLESTQPLVVAG